MEPRRLAAFSFVLFGCHACSSVQPRATSTSAVGARRTEGAPPSPAASNGTAPIRPEEKQPPTIVCTLAACSSGASLELHVPRDPALLADAKISVCHNRICASVVFPTPFKLDPNDPPFHGRLVGPLATGVTSSDVKVTQLSEGWSLISVREQASGPHSDGDLYSIVVTDGRGSELLHVDRRVEFADFYPNGPACDKVPCRIASLDLWPSSESGLSCDGRGCSAVATFAGKLPVQPAALAGATVKACRNESCADAVIDEEFASSDNFATRLRGALTGSFSFRGDGASNSYTIRVHGEPAALKNGDRYRVSIVTADHTKLLDQDRRITYDESYPNRHRCDAVSCKVASISADAMPMPGRVPADPR